MGWPKGKPRKPPHLKKTAIAASTSKRNVSLKSTTGIINIDRFKIIKCPETGKVVSIGDLDLSLCERKDGSKPEGLALVDADVDEEWIVKHNSYIYVNLYNFRQIDDVHVVCVHCGHSTLYISNNVIRNDFYGNLYHHLMECNKCDKKLQKWIKKNLISNDRTIPSGAIRKIISEILLLRSYDKECLWLRTRCSISKVDQYIYEYRNLLRSSNLFQDETDMEKQEMALLEIDIKDVPGVWCSTDKDLEHTKEALVLQNFIVFEKQNKITEVEDIDHSEKPNYSRGILCRFCCQRFSPKSCDIFRNEFATYHEHFMNCNQIPLEFKAPLLDENNNPHPHIKTTTVQDNVWKKIWERMHSSNPFSTIK